MGLEAGGDDTGEHEVYSDADWASHSVDRNDLRLSSHVDRGPISWSSKKRRSVATSRCKSEYGYVDMFKARIMGCSTTQRVRVVASPRLLKDDGLATCQ